MPSFARASIVALIASCGVAFAGGNGQTTNAQNANGQNANAQYKSGKTASNTETFNQNNKPVAFRVFTNAVNSLREQSAGTNQLTQDQLSKIDAITKEFNAKLVAFRTQNQAQFDSYKQQFPENNASNEPAYTVTSQKVNGTKVFTAKPTHTNASQQISPEAAKANFDAQVAFLKLNRQAPKVSEIYPKVWNVLSEGQRRAVSSNIETARNQWAQQHPERLVKANSSFNAASLPADQREKFQSMTPQERATFIKQWQETRQSNAGGDQ